MGRARLHRPPRLPRRSRSATRRRSQERARVRRSHPPQARREGATRRDDRAAAMAHPTVQRRPPARPPGGVPSAPARRRARVSAGSRVSGARSSRPTVGPQAKRPDVRADVPVICRTGRRYESPREARTGQAGDREPARAWMLSSGRVRRRTEVAGADWCRARRHVTEVGPGLFGARARGAARAGIPAARGWFGTLEAPVRHPEPWRPAKRPTEAAKGALSTPRAS